MTVPAVWICGDCGAEAPPSLLACPRCGRLAHADTLKRLAGEADRAERSGDAAAGLAAWRQALALLPSGSVQHGHVLAKVQALSARVPAMTASVPVPDAVPAAGSGSGAAVAGAGRYKWLAGLGAIGVLLLKFKWVILFLLSKGKVLLVGLTQAKTFLSMVIALGVYAGAFGWQFALGLVVSIYVHEMGHVVWLRRYGIPATAPMFIPGVGAFVRLKQHPATVGEDARVGLAGPIWGAGAAAAALSLGLALHQPILFAIARVGAWINLFNLLPIWQLDGGRGFVALSRRQRGWVAATAWLLALLSGDGMSFILAITASLRAAAKTGAPEKGDRAVFATFILLVAGLTALMIVAGRLGPLPDR